jgi:phage terminase large subunit-like protein
MVEGENGILAGSPDHDRPDCQSAVRRLTWGNGTIATCYSADEPDRLRGPQHDGAWCDEIASWRYPDAWDMLMLGLRIGKNPRVVATTTPRPVKLIRGLLAREGGDVAVTRGRTVENVKNLADAEGPSVSHRAAARPAVQARWRGRAREPCGSRR